MYKLEKNRIMFKNKLNKIGKKTMHYILKNK